MIRIASKENTDSHNSKYGPRSYMFQTNSFVCFFLSSCFGSIFLIYRLRISCMYRMHFIHIQLSCSLSNTSQIPQHILFPTSSCLVLPTSKLEFLPDFIWYKAVHLNHSCWEFINAWPSHIQKSTFDSPPPTCFPALTFFPSLLS